jgi:hypothetical protein
MKTILQQAKFAEVARDAGLPEHRQLDVCVKKNAVTMGPAGECRWAGAVRMARNSVIEGCQRCKGDERRRPNLKVNTGRAASESVPASQSAQPRISSESTSQRSPMRRQY